MRALQVVTLTAVLGFASFSNGQVSPPSLTTLFNSGSYGSLASGENGALYGTSERGEVFKLTPPASPGGAWTETVLYTFTGLNGDGLAPLGGPVFGNAGVLYGTTQEGGQMGLGTVYKLVPSSSPGGAWTESVIYSFTGGSDGSYPFTSVAVGKSGAIYGTTSVGGSPTGCFPYGCGTVFKLVPPSSPGGLWMETVLYSFTGGSDGSGPSASLVIGSKGELYSTTEYGGTSLSGTVFELTPPASPGGAWTETVLHAFTGENGDGLNPYAGLVISQGGVLYGTTTAGGTSSGGVVFALIPPAFPGGAWTETLLHSFAAGSDGADPLGGLVIASTGALFGTTHNFGASTSCPGYDCGTVFALKPPASPGGTWTEIVLHSFTSGRDGAGPWGSLVIGKSGVLYGTTSIGGPSNGGTVFKVTL